jgi:bile acid-coenzyme A ligase
MTEQSVTPFGVAFADLAAADPSRPAITHEGRTLTREELERRTNRLARAYRQLGVERDSFVTIGLPNGIEFFEATIAAWKLGATPQPVSSRLPSAERDAIVDLAAPSLAVGFEYAGKFASVPSGFEPSPSLPDDPLEPAVASSVKAPTSGGSTGRPKIIVSASPATLETFGGFAAFLQMQPGGVCLCTGPLYHNGPFSSSAVALLTGNHLVIMTRFDPSLALQLVERYRVTWMYAVPTMMLRIWRVPDEERTRYALSSLQIVYHMAAPCPPWLKQAWIDWLGPDKIWELYGGTEGQSATALSGTEWLEHRGSVGRVWFGEMRILDPDGNELQPGEVGEIWMRTGEGQPASYRYVGAEAKARDGWESLGDMGWMDADGYLYITDRDTDMILVGGANVYPAEIEAALEEHPAVLSSCVIGLPHEDLGSVPHAIVQLHHDVPDDDLAAHLRERLVPYKLPRTFERVTEPLRDEAGKVRRSALRTERLPAQ